VAQWLWQVHFARYPGPLPNEVHPHLALANERSNGEWRADRGIVINTIAVSVLHGTRKCGRRLDVGPDLVSNTLAAMAEVARLLKQRLAGEVMLKRVKLGDALRLYPREMSGGMRQRWPSPGAGHETGNRSAR
jgi:hypothetical protein